MPNYKNPGKIEFTAVIIEGDGGGAFVEFPHCVQELYGVKGRVPIKATFDAEPYRGSLAKMSADCHVLGVIKQIRESIGKGIGDKVRVTVELDEDERKIELAADARSAMMKNARAKANWEKLSFTNQREYHLWIEGAKKVETRQRRIAEMIEKLEAGTPK